MKIKVSGIIALVALLAVPMAAQDVFSGEGPTRALKTEQKIGDQLPLDLKFLDEKGREVTLGDYFKDERPVVISLVG